jgi:hypothetical protein
VLQFLTFDLYITLGTFKKNLFMCFFHLLCFRFVYFCFFQFFFFCLMHCLSFQSFFLFQIMFNWNVGLRLCKFNLLFSHCLFCYCCFLVGLYRWFVMIFSCCIIATSHHSIWFVVILFINFVLNCHWWLINPYNWSCTIFIKLFQLVLNTKRCIHIIRNQNWHKDKFLIRSWLINQVDMA